MEILKMKYKYFVHENMEDEDGWFYQEFVEEGVIDEEDVSIIFSEFPIQNGYEITFYDYVREE